MSSKASSGELLKLTHRMLSAAEAGKWEEVRKIDVRRQMIIQELGAVLNNLSDAISCEAIAGDLREALSVNSRLVDIGQRAKNELAASLGGLSQGRRAVKAYHGIR